MSINAIRKKDVRFGIGLMSGTSCDGIDVALIRLKGTGQDLAMKLMEFRTIPYPRELRHRLLSGRMNSDELCTLNFELGERFATAAREVLDHAERELIEVDFIASSGHTVAHIPPRDTRPAGTLQIGEAAVIAERCGLPVISDFRTRDMAAGGQGAPLVPYTDWQLFHRPDRNIVLLNIGGIANMTVVAPKLDDVVAFDTGPGNMSIDGAVRLLSAGARDIDHEGAMAAQGVVIDEFLDYLLAHPYFNKLPPKSTGREEFGPDIYLRDALASRRDQRHEDLIATVTTAVAYSIVRAYNRFVKTQYDISRFIISGGGTHNKTLLRRIKKGLPGLTTSLSDKYGIPADAREAIAFAILGNETICGTPANVPKATGASHSVVLGKITPA